MSIRGSYRQLGRGKLGAGCWFESAISRILKLLVKAKDVKSGVFVRNCHHETIGKADRLWNRFKLF